MLLIFLAVIYTVFLFILLLSIIMENGSPARTLAWMFFIMMVPLVGMGFYFLIGKNYRKIKLFRVKKTKDHEIYDEFVNYYYNQFDTNYLVERTPIERKKKLIKLLIKNSKALLTTGNIAKVLNNGKETFDSLFEALETAEQYIHIQYYILEEGKLADRLARLFEDKVKQGVTVRVTYDGVGSWSLSKTYIEKLEKMGVQIHSFMPVHFGKYANKVNYRNHRKIVVIDGLIGFTGGINISDKYIFGDSRKVDWRDTHLRLEGPAVNSMQMVFLTDWYFITGEYLFQKKDFFPAEKKGGCPVQIVTSGPDSDYASIKQEYFSLITSAERYIYIWTPYFVPGEDIMFSLKTTALSGVDVRIILPEDSDSALLKWSTRSYLEELLETGVKIYFYKKGFMHSKVLVSDDMVASIGTANVDERSFDTNFEVNALIYSPEICQQLKEDFLTDQSNSEPVMLGAFRIRPKKEKIKESMAKLLSPLL